MSPVGKQFQSYMREAAKAVGTGSGGDSGRSRRHPGSREDAMSRGSETNFLRGNGKLALVLVPIAE
eukprot:6208352-Pleurochrysis_carterae.AAC.1